MALGPDAFSLLHAPGKVSELGLPEGLVEDLFMRRILNERLTTVSRAADALAVSHAVGDELAESLRQKNLVEYHGVEGRDYRISLTERGQRLTAERMQFGRHVATMPVPLQDYKTLVQLQRAEVTITRPKAKEAFADMVLEDQILDQIGPAFLSDGAIFFYGPPGTGKTSLAERMSRFFTDRVLIPRFVEVDGQIISVFDPAMHEEDEEQPPGLDPRYVLCKRPLIMVGGELTLAMMDLQYDTVSGLNAAPIQLLANNGILVVDDFGRQTPSPEQILNRWIIPLSRGIDFLRPNTGTKFTVPFELKLVISTNIDPHALGDDAFLRRLRNKVFVGACSEAAFNWILVRAAKRERIEVTPATAAYLTKVTRNYLGELRPYVAVDFCEMALGICRYDGLDQVLDERLIDRVANVYFVHGDDSLAPAIVPGPGTTLNPVSDPVPSPNPASNRTVDQAPYGHDDAQRQATTSDEAPASPAPSAEPVPPGSTRPVATPRPEHRVAQPLQSRPIANPGR